MGRGHGVLGHLIEELLRRKNPLVTILVGPTHFGYHSGWGVFNMLLLGGAITILKNMSSSMGKI